MQQYIHTFIILSLVLYFEYLSQCKAAQCSQLSTESDCLKNPSCSYSDLADPPCYCGSDAPLDIMFIIDESKSMKAEGFQSAKHFVADMIDDGVSESSNIHIAKFSKIMRNVYNFSQIQTNNSLVSQTIRNNSYQKKGNTRMLDALVYAVNVFGQWEQHPNYRGYSRLFVFLTDGRPFPRTPYPAQSPCPMVKALHDAVAGNVVVIGLGAKWRLKDIKCMVTPNYDYDNIDASAVYDPDRVIAVPDWSDGISYIFTLYFIDRTVSISKTYIKIAQFDTANVDTQAFLCPDAFSLKFTEIRMNTFESDIIAPYTSRFVEFYNDGENPLDLSINNLVFDGFMTSQVFGVTGNPTCNITIPLETFVVFYDPSAPDLPNCPSCNCSLSGTQLWCNDALYIPCDSNSTTSGCGNCTWNYNMVSYLFLTVYFVVLSFDHVHSKNIL